MKHCTFSAQAQKKKKSTTRKFLTLQETETPQKISYIFSKENFCCISANENPECFFYISRNGTFLYFKEWYIQNLSTFRTRSIFRTLVCLNK